MSGDTPQPGRSPTTEHLFRLGRERPVGDHVDNPALTVGNPSPFVDNQHPSVEDPARTADHRMIPANHHI